MRNVDHSLLALSSMQQGSDAALECKFMMGKVAEDDITILQ
jgi:hypothetical protein